MAEPQPQQGRRPGARVSGIAAAALEGAREGEEQNVAKNDPDANAAAMSRPAPGMTDKPQSNTEQTPQAPQ